MAGRRNIIPYNPDLKSVAKDLRRTMTISEVLLWNELKQKRMLGFDFDRQKPLGNYIVDFFARNCLLQFKLMATLIITGLKKIMHDSRSLKILEFGFSDLMIR